MNLFLFAATAILWGSSAIVTSHQAMAGAPEVSVGYRMAIVSLVMFGWSFFSGRKLFLSRRDCPWILLQGILFFGLAFICFYHSTQLIPSGIAALILSTSSLFAALASWAFMSLPITLRSVLGMILGTVGLAIVALPQLTALSSSSQTLTGILLALASAACTGWGTVVAMRNQRAGLPITVLMSWAALFGAVFSFALAAFNGSSFHIEMSPDYFASLAYLSIIASCLTFFMYFNLVQRAGAANASYTMALVPLVALLLSAIFENLQINSYVACGGLAVLVGNMFVLSDPATRKPRALEP